MHKQRNILIVGSYDTKQDELEFLAEVIKAQSGGVVRMDVSVLGSAIIATEISKHQVAAAASSSIEQIIALGDENLAFQKMAQGAASLTTELYAAGKIDAMIALGGTMGTDLALECAAALPMGVPKYLVSTVAFSPLLSPERIAPDIQMILWAGGLYGLNSLCRATLAQAGGAVVGAAQAALKLDSSKPLIGITSLGKSTLRYMVYLLPELEQRGFEVAVFHSTGLGGRALAHLAAQGRLACVLDFCLQELINDVCGSEVNSGPERLLSAGRAGVPQMLAPGASDIIDFIAAKGPPAHLAGREHHAHNRLIDSVVATDSERAALAQRLAADLSQAQAPVCLFIPLQGMIEWDRPGMPTHNPQGLARFIEALRLHVKPHIATVELDCHINDKLFAAAVLEQFDQWLTEGIVKTETHNDV